MAKEYAKSLYSSKEWQEVRSYCLKRDKYKCRRCNRPAEEVHHIIHVTPENIGNVNITLNPYNLECLCRTCHQSEHEADRIAGHKELTPEEKEALHLDYYFDDNGMLQRKGASPPG